MKVAVVFGGKSTENYVSRMSAASVIRNLDKEKYEIILIGITETGKWFQYNGPVEEISGEDWAQYAEVDARTGTLVNGMELLARPDIDVIFPVLHGPNGEDGTVQGLFELMGKPYVGCGVLASAVSMDKSYTKIICEKEGIPQCDYCLFQRSEVEAAAEQCADQVEDQLSYPVFVKPCNAGSSFGVSKAKDRAELIQALQTAAGYDIRILVEEFIDGREIECAVLGNDTIRVAVPGEVIAANEFYDYEAKYFNDASVTEVPANITEEQKQAVTEYARRIFRCLDCSGLSRIDFFLRRDTGTFIFNEINTLPGFTRISMYAKMWEASGLMYPELLDELIKLAFDNYQSRKRKYTE